MPAPADPLSVLFVMEQHLGHRTFALNLRAALEGAEGLDADWVEVDYAPAGAWFERIPRLPEGARGPLRGRQAVRRALRSHPGHVRFFNTQVPAALAGRRLVARRPYVLCTDITPIQYDAMGEAYGHRADEGGLVARVKHRINTRLFGGAARTICWSTWTRDSVVADYGVDAGRTEVIPPGVDTPRWAEVASGRTASGPARLLFVGGDFERKGGPSLLRAVERLPAGAVQVAVVTRSPVEPRPGLTVHHGLEPNSPELLALYRDSDVFVLPSTAEAFGIAAAEASAAGLPVVATAVGGLRDIVVDGETGILVPPGDDEALAGALRHLGEATGLRARMGDAAQRRAAACFDARTNARRLLDSLRTLQPVISSQQSRAGHGRIPR